MSYTVQEVTSKSDWNKKLSSYSYYHFLQSWQWGELKGQNGWQAFRYEVLDGKNQVAMFQLLTRRLHRRVPILVAYTPKGPIFESEKIELNKLLTAVEQTARSKGCAYVKVDADIPEESPAGQSWKAALKSYGWKFSKEQIQTKNTGHTELLPDKKDGEETLLSGMNKRWRYNTRAAAKRGVTIRKGSLKDMKDFYNLYLETGSRQSFGIRSLSYYKQVYKAFDSGQNTESLLLFADHKDDDKPLSGAFFLRFYDRVWYFYAASSTRRRPDMPNYLLQWEALKWARSTGAHHYDWGGASTNIDDKNDPMARVWHFKKGFGAKFFESTGAWDKPLNSFQWLLYRTASRVFKTLAR